MGPVYTRKPQRPREASSSHHRPGSEAATQLALTCGGPEARAPRTFRRHRSPLVSSFCQAGVLALAARQPAGTGSAQIRCSIAPNRRRVRWLSASNSQESRACLTSRPPVLTRRCWRLVNDQLSMRVGSTSRRQRFPRLSASTLSGSLTSCARNRGHDRRVQCAACLPSLIPLLRRSALVVKPHDGTILERKIRQNEADAREQLADVVLDFRHDPSGRGPALRPIPETLVPDQRPVARSSRRTKQEVFDLDLQVLVCWYPDRVLDSTCLQGVVVFIYKHLQIQNLFLTHFYVPHSDKQQDQICIGGRWGC